MAQVVIAWEVLIRICKNHLIEAEGILLGICLIYGDKDTQAPVAMAYRLNNSCKSEKQMLIIRGAGHTDCYKIDPLRYENAVYEFIKNHIT